MPEVYRLDPLCDPRWIDFLERNEEASVFHSPSWHESLRRTYGFVPIVFTTSPPTVPLTNGVVFSRVASWITGQRLVSAAFADHCQPLANRDAELTELIDQMKGEMNRESCEYFELRPVRENPAWIGSDLRPARIFQLHTLDLRPDLHRLLNSTHKSCFQRKLRRAQRENLNYVEGNSKQLLREFYRLLLKTRRRHGLPPQPFAWFANLHASFGDSMQVRLACKGPLPIAGIVTLRHKNTLVYKYGGSDARYHALGGMTFLFWQAIQEAKSSGALQMDLGRSDIENQGLSDFKEHLGASAQPLHYYRYPAQAASVGQYQGLGKTVWNCLPDWANIAAGKMLYRHIA